uniref:Uncharacterized protein n=1 Tax=Amblyomma triste TaxID=251400 RepID=A0A023G1A8_AMBTT
MTAVVTKVLLLLVCNTKKMVFPRRHIDSLLMQVVIFLSVIGEKKIFSEFTVHSLAEGASTFIFSLLSVPGVFVLSIMAVSDNQEGRNSADLI